jgi:hypothetical protein
MVGVRYGPVSQRLTVLTDHPPSARSEIRFMCERNLRFCPTRTSYTAESKKRLRRVPAMLPRFAGRSKRLASEVPSSGAQIVKGKYKTTRKKVVSKLHQAADGTNQFLESTGELSLAVPPPYVLISPLDYVAVLTGSL